MFQSLGKHLMINNIIGLINFRQKYDYSTRISSIINAVSIWWYCWHNNLPFAVDHILGYILCDLLVVSINYREFKDFREIIAHHVSCFLMCYLGYNYIFIYPEVSKAFLLMEISTIFSNIRWFMDYHEIKGIPYLINGFLFWASFGWFRILPIQYFTNFIVYNSPLFLIFYLPLTFLNIKWFYLITKGLLKKLFIR
jgi:hypothetical protein